MINKKIILASCLGNIIGGSLFALSDLYQKREQNIFEFDITSAVTVFSGCFAGALFGFISGLFCCLNDGEDNGAYREFFESQQIIDNTHYFQSSNEFAPLLQEYILEINDEQFIPNNNADLVFNRAFPKNCVNWQNSIVNSLSYTVFWEVSFNLV